MEPDRPLSLLTGPPTNVWDSSEMFTWELYSLGIFREKAAHPHYHFGQLLSKENVNSVRVGIRKLQKLMVMLCHLFNDQVSEQMGSWGLGMEKGSGMGRDLYVF